MKSVLPSAVWMIAIVVASQHSMPAVAADNMTQTSPAASTAESSAGLKSPSTAVELLRNLKEAFDRGLLLDPAFYDEETLKNSFNQQRVKWQTPKLPQRLLAAIDGNQESFPGLLISVERNSYFEDIGKVDAPDVHERVNAHLHIDIDIRGLRVDADMMRSVFGADGKVSKAPSQYLQGKIGAAVDVTQVQFGAAPPRKPGIGRRFATFKLYKNDTIKEIDIVDERVY